MKRHPWLRRIFTGALIGAAFLFLALEIYRNADQLRSFRWEVQPALLALSVAMLAAVLLWGVVVWRVVVRGFGVEVPLRPLARAWFLANLSRYIPGVVWQFVSLAQLGPSVGLAPAAMITTLLGHVGFSLLSAAVVGAWLLPARLAGELAPILEALRWASPLAVALVHPAVIRMVARVATRASRGAPLEWQGSWLYGIWLLALSTASWVLYGLAFFLFLDSFVGMPGSAIPSAIAINALAFIVGYVVVIAPGGLGFKEGAIALLLGGLVPPAVAASLAIASRLWTIAAEVIPALLLARRQALQA